MAETGLNGFLRHLRSVLHRQVGADTPDADLLGRYVGQGDEAAFEALVDYLTIPAPYDGTIVARNANSWDFVEPGKGSPIYAIDRVDVVRVFIDVPEKDANSVKIGTKATVLIPALRDEPIPAAVRRTSWVLNAKSRTLRAEIHLPNLKGEILPGLYAYGKLFVERPRVWALPLRADERVGDKSFYWGYAQGRLVRTEVQTGVSDGDWIEVVKRRSPGSGDDDRWESIDGSEQMILGDPSSHAG